jgi:hypothetical protein
VAHNSNGDKRDGLCAAHQYRGSQFKWRQKDGLCAVHQINEQGLLAWPLRGPPEQMKNEEMPWSTIAVHQGTNATQQMKSLVSPRSGLHTAHQNGDRQAIVEHNSGTDQCSDRSNDVDGDDEIQRRIWMKSRKTNQWPDTSLLLRTRPKHDNYQSKEYILTLSRIAFVRVKIDEAGAGGAIRI